MPGAVHAKRMLSAVCEPSCSNSCSELNGDVAVECNGCGADHTCWPGSRQFPKHPSIAPCVPLVLEAQPRGSGSDMWWLIDGSTQPAHTPYVEHATYRQELCLTPKEHTLVCVDLCKSGPPGEGWNGGFITIFQDDTLAIGEFSVPPTSSGSCGVNLTYRFNASPLQPSPPSVPPAPPPPPCPPNSPPQPPDIPSSHPSIAVQIFVYPDRLPPYTAAALWRFNELRRGILTSSLLAHAEDDADFFLLSSTRDLIDDQTSPQRNSDVASMFRNLAHYNGSSKRITHFLLSPCDTGPLECMYKSGWGAKCDFDDTLFRSPQQCMREKARVGSHGRLPASIQPFNRRRKLGFITLTGDLVRSAHVVGLDIRLPSDDGHQCGPLCGMRHLARKAALEKLRRLSPWGRAANETVRQLHVRRRLIFFWSGKVTSLHDERRRLYTHHRRRPGFLVHQATGDEDTSNDGWLPEQMAESDFCGSPPGQNGGDSDRYLPAVLYGCIPVFFTVGEGRPFEEVLPWDEISLTVTPDQIPRLHSSLASLNQSTIITMRMRMRHVWERLLWTRACGSYLGEDGHADALSAFTRVLQRRKAADAGRRRPYPRRGGVDF